MRAFVVVCLDHDSLLMWTSRNLQCSTCSTAALSMRMGACSVLLFLFLFFKMTFLPPFSSQFRRIQLLVITILSHRYNSHTGSGETKVESYASSETQPNHCFLTQRASNPEASRTNVSEETPCTWLPWLACTAPGPPQESLVRDETRISLPAKPSLTRMTLVQLCFAPRTSRSRPVTTEPEREARDSDGTAGAVVQRP